MDPHAVFRGKLAEHGRKAAAGHFLRIIQIIIALVGPVFRQRDELRAACMCLADEICGCFQIIFIAGRSIQLNHCGNVFVKHKFGFLLLD